MDQLPEGMRRVLILHDVEGYTHEEIGDCLGVTAGTSKSQLFKARAKMRDLLRSERDTTRGNRSMERLSLEVLARLVDEEPSAEEKKLLASEPGPACASWTRCKEQTRALRRTCPAVLPPTGGVGQTWRHASRRRVLIRSCPKVRSTNQTAGSFRPRPDWSSSWEERDSAAALSGASEAETASWPQDPFESVDEAVAGGAVGRASDTSKP